VRTPGGPPDASDVPVARLDELQEERLGIVLSDPYTWMEDVGCEEMRGWLSGQGAYAAAELAELGRDGLLARVTGLTAGAVRRALFKLATDRMFYLQSVGVGSASADD
jgi:hypothetical protein